MTILFFHQTFPGQQLHLAAAAAARGHHVVAMAMEACEQGRHDFTIARYPIGPCLPGTCGGESCMNTADPCRASGACVARRLRDDGFLPDIICAHPDWEDAAFLKDVWPQARRLNYSDFYYQAIHAARADL